MARLSRTTRLIVALGALALLAGLGLGFALLRPAEEENPWEFLGPADDDVTSLVFDPTTPTTLYAATFYNAYTKVRMAAPPGGIFAGQASEEHRSPSPRRRQPRCISTVLEACTRAQMAGKPGARSTGG
jgi:hypothetical protein